MLILPSWIRQGQLIANPVSYRDDRTEGMMEAVFKRVPRSEVFAQTGVQFMRINTLYQLMSLHAEQFSPTGDRRYLADGA